jgi:hypothetical protein
MFTLVVLIGNADKGGYKSKLLNFKGLKMTQVVRQF